MEAIVMSNVETTALPGGGSTITLSPADKSTIYQHQGRYIVAEVTMATGVDIPLGAMINFTEGNSKKSSGFLPLPGEPDAHAVPIVPDPSDSTKGHARLCIRHDPADTTNTITIYAQAAGPWGAVTPPLSAGPVGYTILTYDPTVTIAGPDNQLLTLPGPGDDEFAPQDASGKYTAHFSCTVVDDTTSTPISDYVVEWHEAGAHSAGLFSYMVNAYTSQTASYVQRLTGKGPEAGLIEDETQGGYYVRMVTNSSGVADLYIVAKHSPGKYVSALIPQFDYTDFTPLQAAFMVYDPNDVTLTRWSPDVSGVVLENNQPTLDFGQLSDPPNVSVTIDPYDKAGPADKVYLLCNDAIVAGPYVPPNSQGTWEWNAVFPDSFCHSDSGLNAYKVNVATFVVARGGNVLVSAHNNFFGKGDTQEGLIPTDGPLERPTLDPLATKISGGYLDANVLSIDIDLLNQPADGGWTPKQGDRVSAMAYMTGWATGGAVKKTATATIPSVTLDQPTIGSGTLTLQFPSNDPFEGFDSNRNPPYTQSMCQIVYSVLPKGGSPYQLLYSQVLTVILNTPNQS
jgi:hypothetical protein